MSDMMGVWLSGEPVVMFRFSTSGGMQCIMVGRMVSLQSTIAVSRPRASFFPSRSHCVV